MAANVLQGAAEELKGREFTHIRSLERWEPPSRQKHGAAQLKVALEVIRKSFTADATETK